MLPQLPTTRWVPAWKAIVSRWHSSLARHLQRDTTSLIAASSVKSRPWPRMGIQALDPRSTHTFRAHLGRILLLGPRLPIHQTISNKSNSFNRPKKCPSSNSSPMAFIRATLWPILAIRVIRCRDSSNITSSIIAISSRIHCPRRHQG